VKCLNAKSVVVKGEWYVSRIIDKFSTTWFFYERIWINPRVWISQGSIPIEAKEALQAGAKSL